MPPLSAPHAARHATPAFLQPFSDASFPSFSTLRYCRLPHYLQPLRLVICILCPPRHHQVSAAAAACCAAFLSVFSHWVTEEHLITYHFSASCYYYYMPAKAACLDGRHFQSVIAAAASAQTSTSQLNCLFRRFPSFSPFSAGAPATGRLFQTTYSFIMPSPEAGSSSLVVRRFSGFTLLFTTPSETPPSRRLRRQWR